MSLDSPADKVTLLLRRVQEGDAEAVDSLLEVLYTELKSLAHRQRMRQQAPETLNTTALLHEGYLKLVNAKGTYADRAHFFRVAAKAMRQILIDSALRHKRAKRGGDAQAVTFDDEHIKAEGRAEEVLALDEALKRLALLSPRQEEVVELRYFAGFSVEETAEIVGISSTTVSREWTAARAWLQRELKP